MEYSTSVRSQIIDLVNLCDLHRNTVSVKFMFAKDGKKNAAKDARRITNGFNSVRQSEQRKAIARGADKSMGVPYDDIQCKTLEWDDYYEVRFIPAEMAEPDHEIFIGGVKLER